MSKIYNFKPLKNEQGVLDYSNNSFFFGSAKKHGRKIRGFWNSLSLTKKDNSQVDKTLALEILGVIKKK